MFAECVRCQLLDEGERPVCASQLSALDLERLGTLTSDLTWWLYVCGSVQDATPDMQPFHSVHNRSNHETKKKRERRRHPVPIML
jgi:hypothetical protein